MRNYRRNEIAQFKLAEVVKFVEKNVREDAFGRLEAIIKPHIFYNIPKK